MFEKTETASEGFGRAKGILKPRVEKWEVRKCDRKAQHGLHVSAVDGNLNVTCESRSRGHGPNTGSALAWKLTLATRLHDFFVYLRSFGHAPFL